MIKNFTRGSQVTMHTVKMARQAIAITLAATLILGACMFSLKSWYDYTPFERASAWAYYWGDFKLNIPFAKDPDRRRMTQYYTYRDGSKGIVRTLDIVNDPWHRELADKVENQLFSNAMTTLWSMLGFFLLACAGWAWRGSRIKVKKILSGTQVVTPKELQKVLDKKRLASSFKLGGVNLRVNSETQHMLLCGTTGVGKSNGFIELMPQIRQKGHKAVVVDTTGEFVSRFYRTGKDILLNPFDARSVGWNPWVECPMSYHYDEIAYGFVPQTGHDRFWADSARTVLSEAMGHLKEKGSTDCQSLVDLLMVHSLADLYKALKHTPAGSLLDPAGDKTAMSIRAHLAPYLKVLRHLAGDKPAFSMRQWVMDSQGPDDSWVFIASTPDQRETMKSLMSAVMTVAFNSLMNVAPDPDRRVWFMIDELVSLHKQEVLPKALAEVRKYGGCIVAGIQSVSQLQEQYGYAETKSLSSLFNTKVIFRNTDHETARTMSQLIGEQEVIEAMETISYGEHAYRDGVSLNDQKKIKPAVSATDIMALNDMEAYLKLPGALPVARVLFTHRNIQKICPAFIAKAENILKQA